MGIRYFDYIISIPSFLIGVTDSLAKGTFLLENIDITYLWASMYILFTSKMIINNIKIYLSSNGADDK